MDSMKTIVNELRDELRTAHIIIRSALSVATFDQKMEWANMNERDDVIGEGITRANERQAAIDGDDADLLYRELTCADRIIANVKALLSEHQCELWDVAIRHAGVVSRRQTRDEVRGEVLARAANALSIAKIGLDVGDRAGDRTVVVIKPIRQLSPDDAAELRRLAESLAGQRRGMLMKSEFDMHAFLRRQRAFSEHTFGPGRRTAGVCNHIRKELAEVEAAPDDLREWVDVILLGLDGAWRTDATPEQITAAISAKLAENERRVWPDWRTSDPNRAIEHIEQATEGGQA
ncbi:dATP/dGTP pyrophosphohydrolase domain-containing protein [Burkholderia pseudomallei]|uniref:dATP/dGTP pyrophosphohydrolase domain-containing protein n=1 Tax=Burkholderia pseudomallei TaxID=28450 RepID=UPI0012B906E0|nr:dATP/dGTP pyrophosphohydrolase domain-containing protein [Burkholderia pseudomallei]